jgi:hypothetical protein
MRYILFLILIFNLCLNSFSQNDSVNGYVTVLNHSDDLKYQSYMVDSKTHKTNLIEVFKTYEIDNNTFEINTGKNEFSTLSFVDGTVLKLEQESEFRIDLMNVVLKNTKKFPSKIEIDSSNINLSLVEGESYFSVSKPILLQTSLSNIGLDIGRFYVQSTKKSVMIYVIDGKIDVYDNVVDKKESVLSGNAVLIRPSPTLSPKQMELFGDKMVTTVKKVKSEQFKPYLDKILELETLKKDVVFVKIDNNIIGINIK